MMAKKKYTLLWIFLILVVVIFVAILFYNLGQENRDDNTPTNKSMNLSKEDILVSFRIDDITFETKQKQFLINALYLARKYNITFDLAVIAKPFDEKADPEVFKIYQDNQDVFEVVAHGYNHADYQNESCRSNSCFINTSCGEFKCASYEQQNDHIKKMKAIFEKRNLYWGTKIFAVSWHSGDENTINLAKNYGYQLMTQSDVTSNSYEYKLGDLTISKVYIGIAMNQTISTNEVKKYVGQLNNYVNKNQTKIQIIMHPINFYKTENSEELIKGFIEARNTNPKIKFGFISEGLMEDFEK
jgi:predicted deacetylase